jgi:hypothetical protein
MYVFKLFLLEKSKFVQNNFFYTLNKIIASHDKHGSKKLLAFNIIQTLDLI